MPGVLVNSRMSRHTREGKEKKSQKVEGHPEGVQVDLLNLHLPDVHPQVQVEGLHVEAANEYMIKPVPLVV